jgi:hypothetical protein
VAQNCCTLYLQEYVIKQLDILVDAQEKNKE